MISQPRAPLLTVVIPTRNRAASLSDLILSLAVQERTPFAWEVLVVDNGSTDATAETVERLRPSLPIALRCVHEAEPGLHRGRNRGAAEARGRYLAYLDDDMILARTWINGVRPLLEGAADAVVGRILPKWEAPPPRWLRLLCAQGNFGHLGILDLGEKPRELPGSVIFGGNCFIPRELVFGLGGFHPDAMPPDLIRFRGDGETGLFSKFEERGLRGRYEPTACAFHVIGRGRMTDAYLLTRAFNQGISASYTAIRREAAAGSPGEAGGTQATARASRILRRLRSEPLPDLVRLGIVRMFTRGIRRRMRESEAAGFAYHQNEVRADPDLRRWVTRETYLA